jgi:hypothetical protein
LRVFFVAINPHYGNLSLSEQRPIERKGNMKLTFTLKRKARKHEIKHLRDTLGFTMTEKMVIIPEVYSGVIRMYKEDGLI